MSNRGTSPLGERLSRLLREVSTQDAPGRAEATFWAEVRAGGSPIVEPDPEDASRCLVTFVWQATSPRVSAVSISGLPREDPLDQREGLQPMLRVPGTTTWYITAALRADARVAYGFRERLVVPDTTETGPASAPLLHDPTNPASFPDETADASIEPLTADPDWRVSVIRLPQARDCGLFVRRSGVEPGRTRRLDVHSARLGTTRRVWVHTTPAPSGASEERWLLVLNDGFEWAAVAALRPLVDNLVDEGRVPPLVVAMQESPAGRRLAELGCNDDFATMVAEELVPMLRAGWPVRPTPERTIIGGQSFGGLSAAHVALHHPEVFGHVLSQSGSFWFPRPHRYDDPTGLLIGEFASRPRQPLRFYLEVGIHEGWMVPVNRHMRDVLVAKGYDVTYQEVSGGHDSWSWRETITDGLVALTRP